MVPALKSRARLKRSLPRPVKDAFIIFSKTKSLPHYPNLRPPSGRENQPALKRRRPMNGVAFRFERGGEAC